MNNNLLKLPVCLSKDHISDFCVTLPLYVALTDIKLLPWYYGNIVNICNTNQNINILLFKLWSKFYKFI